MFRPKNNAQLLLSIDADMKEAAMAKSKAKFGIGLSTLLKLFIKAFLEQKNIGFYMGDDDFNEALGKLIKRKRMTKLMTYRRKLIRGEIIARPAL